MVFELYTVVTLLVVFTAAFSYINYRFLRLPSTIGVMLISLICSLLLATLGSFIPGLSKSAITIFRFVNFRKLVMEVMLSFLLFAGAIHINWKDMRKERGAILVLASVSVLLSTLIIGYLMFFVFRAFHHQMNILYCFLLGALISPTDPIAVMGILKKVNIPKALEMRITGESMFNDGVAVVLFLGILEVATIGPQKMSAENMAWLFVREAGGGILWGLILGYGAFFLLRTIDQYQVEVLITLSLVMGGYSLANWLHISGPLSMVVAGIITGNVGRNRAMSAVTRDYLTKFWELIDEMLNALLFLLIGFEVLVISIRPTYFQIGLIAFVLVLLARWLSVFVPALLLSFRRTFSIKNIVLLTWGGVRGGISVALALSIPRAMHHQELVPITYVIVIFSIIVQGLTIGKVAKRLTKER